MSKVAFNTPISGNGMVTFDVPPTNSFNTLTIPDESGNLLTSENPVVSKLNGGPLAGFRNRIINGNFSIAQRGTSIACPSGGLTYTLDRWLVGINGTGLTASQGSASTAPFNWLQLAGAAGNTAVSITQRIEAANVRDLVGKKVTVSFAFYNATGNATGATLTISVPSAADNFTTITNTNTFELDLSNQNKQSITFTMPAGAERGLSVQFWANNLTSGLLVLHTVQLEEGEVATPFEFRHIGAELDLCKRYYEESKNNHMFRLSDNPALTTSWVFSVAKRATPTISITDGAGNANRVTLEATSNVTYGTAPTPSTNGVAWNSTLGSGVSGNLCYFRWVASAEL